MAFQPSEMTEATLRRLVDNLVSFNKKSPLPVTPKRSQLQEAVAATLGFASYHAAITSLKTAKAVPHEPPKSLTLADSAGEWLVPLSAMEPNVPSLWKNKVTQGEAGRIAHVENEVFANSGLCKGTEQHRRNWLSALAAANPGRAICVVQGPMSLPIKNLRDATPFSRNSNNMLGLTDVCSASELIDVFVGMLEAMSPTTSDNEMWRGRAISLLSSTIFALVYLRDHPDNLENQFLYESQIKASLDIESLMQLANHKELPPRISQSINAYLRSLPGYNPNVLSFQQPEETRDQHAFLEMQFTDLFQKAYPDQFSRRIPLIARLLSRKVMRFPERAEANGEQHEKQLKSHVEEWIRLNPKGLLIFDVPPLESNLWPWLTVRLPHWLDGGAAVWLGVQSSSDIPASSAPLMNRLAYRLELSK